MSLQLASEIETDKPALPERVPEKWQRIVNALAGLLQVAAVLITRVDPPEIEVLVSSQSANNPYRPGERVRLGSGLCCETVVSTGQPLLIPNALEHEEWTSSPGAARGMLSYLGLPIRWPDRQMFGTICVLDGKQNAHSELHLNLLEQFRESLEDDLRSLIQIQAAGSQERLNAELKHASEHASLLYQESERSRRALLSILEDAKRAEAALRESERKYHQLFATVPDAIVVFDVETRRFIDVNEAAIRLYGYAREEFLELTQQVITAEPGESERFIAAATVRGLVAATDRRHRKRDGTVFPVEISAGAFTLGDRKVVFQVIRDVTERKQAEERARQHQAEIARVARLSSIGEMAAGIAHGLNQPLFAVLANAEACKLAISSARQTPEQVVSDLERICASAEEAGQIVRRLRQFADKHKPSRSIIDVNALIQSSMPFVKDDVMTNNIRLRLELEPGLPTVLADSLLLQQVILNLARNAIEALKCCADGERELLIRTSTAESGTIEVVVCDTGPGLSAESSDKLFEPFFTTKPHGLGLGLSLSRSLVEAEGGQLVAQRNSGRGMTFRFTLPVYTGDHDD
jgi:PAS domain S-box-containing protein